MKRSITKIFSFLAIVVVALTALVACQPAEHKHTYSQTWSFDENNHWHVASCNEEGEGCATAISDSAAHTITDGACSVCGYVAPVVLTGGDQTINATGAGVQYVFTAKLAETYVLTWEDENAKISVNGTQIQSGYEVTLANAESITFVMSTVNGNNGSYAVNFDVKVVVNYLQLDAEGNANVNANGEGIAYVFTAKIPETYVISWTDENAYVMIESEFGGDQIQSGYEFTLGSGESFTFLMSTGDYSDASYSVNIAVKEEIYVLQPDENNNVTVNANGGGVQYVFTAKVANTYVLTWTDENAVVLVGTEIESGYEFTLNSGESITFIMCTGNYSEGSYVVNLSVKEEVVSNILTGGPQTVNATYEGIAYTFTAKMANTYVITWTSENAYIVFEGANVTETIDSDYKFELVSGESVTFVFCTNNTPAEDSYQVSIEVYEAPITTNALVVGTNAIEADAAGTIYTFTSAEGGTYVISSSSEEAYLAIEIGNSTEIIEQVASATITLGAGETVTLTAYPYDTDAASASYNIVIALGE